MRAILIFCFLSFGSLSFYQSYASRAKLRGDFRFMIRGGRNVLVVIILMMFQVSSVNAQAKKVDRAWIGFSHGFNKYNEISSHVQMFKHFSFGGSYQAFRFPHGPTYSVSTSAFTSKILQLQDKQDDFSLFIRMTSIGNHKSFLSVGVGPSFGKSSLFSNIKVETSPITGARYWSYDLEENWRFGFTYRAEFNITIAQVIGLNFGVIGNLNETKNYHRLIVGLNFGFLSPSEN